MAKRQFKAESKRLLDLMVNSIYTHKEIFLREIISNASDACDKLCYQALTDDAVGMSRKDFKIEIKVDKEHRTLTVSDNGIGMDKEDLENNLGVIASSGSYKFKQEVGDDAKDTDVIGQFGVGFYSAFMVADHITVVTRKYGADAAWMWQSSGADGYTITECERDAVGTDIIMHIKADTDDEKYSEFLESWRLQELVRKYSDYIRFPIRMEVSKTRRKEGSPDDKPEYETYQEEETLNSMVPIWQRRKSSVKPEEYNKFYRDKFHDYADPQKVIAVSAEGAVTYKELLQDLLLFYSSTEKKPVTLAEYVSRMKEEQKFIYYAAGESLEKIDKLPQTEGLRESGTEILYFTEEVDEFCAQILHTFQDKEFRSVLDQEIEEGAEKKAEEAADAHKAVFDFVKETLGDQVKEVKASARLKSHPVCLTAGEGLSFEMEKYFQAVQPDSAIRAERILELNVEHPAFQALEAAVTADPEKAKKYATLLYDQALLIAGLPLEDPSGYTDLVCELMK